MFSGRMMNLELLCFQLKYNVVSTHVKNMFVRMGSCVHKHTISLYVPCMASAKHLQYAIW